MRRPSGLTTHWCRQPCGGRSTSRHWGQTLAAARCQAWPLPCRVLSPLTCGFLTSTPVQCTALLLVCLTMAVALEHLMRDDTCRVAAGCLIRPRQRPGRGQAAPAAPEHAAGRPRRGGAAGRPPEGVTSPHPRQRPAAAPAHAAAPGCRAAAGAAAPGAGRILARLARQPGCAAGAPLQRRRRRCCCRGSLGPAGAQPCCAQHA